MTIYQNDGSGEQEATSIPTSLGNATNVYVNHGDGSGEQLYWTDDDGGTDPPPDDYHNLAYYIPDWAVTLWHNKPDDYISAFPTESVTSYAGQSGDLATGIENASANGNVGNLGTDNTYRWDSIATASGSHFGLIGDNCTIHYDRNDLRALMEPNCSVGVVKGVEFVFDETTNTDAGLLLGNFSSEFWGEDVLLTGRRNYLESTASPSTSYTWRPHMTSSSAQGFNENIQLPDGDTYSGSGSPPGGTRTMGINTDPGHDGQIAYKDCYVAHWLGNGYYLSHTDTGGVDGDSLLWNCDAYNNNRGNIRLGINDMAIGGTVEVQDIAGDLQGQGIVFDQETAGASNPTAAIGVTVTGNDFAADAIVARNHQFANNSEAHIRMEKVVLDTNTLQTPVRIQEDDNTSMTLYAELNDCYFYYDHTDPVNNLLEIISGDVTVPDGNLYILSENSDEVEIGSGGTIEIDGTGHPSGTYTRQQLGLDSPLDSNGELPSFGFDYEAAGIAR